MNQTIAAACKAQPMVTLSIHVCSQCSLIYPCSSGQDKKTYDGFIWCGCMQRICIYQDNIITIHFCGNACRKLSRVKNFFTDPSYAGKNTDNNSNYSDSDSDDDNDKEDAAGV